MEQKKPLLHKPMMSWLRCESKWRTCRGSWTSWLADT